MSEIKVTPLEYYILRIAKRKFIMGEHEILLKDFLKSEKVQRELYYLNGVKRFHELRSVIKGLINKGLINGKVGWKYLKVNSIVDFTFENYSNGHIILKLGVQELDLFLSSYLIEARLNGKYIYEEFESLSPILKLIEPYRGLKYEIIENSIRFYENDKIPVAVIWIWKVYAVDRYMEEVDPSILL